MWFMPKRTHESVIIVFDETHLACVYASSTAQGVRLNAYHAYPLAKDSIINGILNNPTLCDTHITHFFKQYVKKNVRVSYILPSTAVSEQFITCQTAHPKMPELFGITHIHPGMHYRYMYPDDHGFIFYTCELAQPLGFQYQLMGLRNNLNLTTITSSTNALINLYYHLYKSAFRPAQFAHDMKRVHNNLLLLFSSDLLARILHMPPSHTMPISNHDRDILLKACGLLVAKGAVG